MLKSALSRAKARTNDDTSPGRCPLPLMSQAKAKLVGRKACEKVVSPPVDPDQFPSPLADVNDARHAFRRVFVDGEPAPDAGNSDPAIPAQPRLHGYDLGDTEQACLGILTGLKKEGLATPASPAQPEVPPPTPTRRVSFSEAPTSTPKRGARYDDGVKQMEDILDAEAAKI